jgi:plastocyanin
VIQEGNFVTWINKDIVTPHTVTFLDGRDPPDVVNPVPQAGGPPMLLLNPDVLMPAAATANAYQGGFLNSGFIGAPPESPTNTFTVRFMQRGTWEYLCLLHPGMTGTVSVIEHSED